MTPGLTFCIGLAMLVLFGWYFATDQGPRKRLLAMALMLVLVVSSIVTIWPPQKKIALGLDIQGGTSFLIRLKGGDKEVTKAMLDQAVEVIRKRVDYFGGGEPIISPVGSDRILVQIPGLDTAKIQDAIYGGDAQITGRFTEEEARGLASVLENPLQTPVSIEEERSVSPTLGLDSIRASILAGLLGLAITLVCVAVYYKIPGLIANLALIINLILLVGALTMFHFVLTLPGIAGIILTIGLSVDANVLIYERLREEMALGKSLKVALNTAYEKAFSSIFDANVTTLITAAILFWKASGPVKGFAIALTLGILASLFTALIVGRNCLGWLVDTRRLKRISMLHLISAQNINFLGKGFIACMCSLALLLAGAAAFYLRGEKNFGVDFRGGDLITLSAPGVIDIGQVRHALQQIGLADASIQESAQGGKSYITIRTPLNTSDRVEKQIMQAMPKAGFNVEGSERVGALVGGELAKSSLIALGLGILGILIFVTFRFELSFAVGAIV